MQRPGHGWAELDAGYSSRDGYGARGELGVNLLPGLAIFGTGSMSQDDRRAMLGLRGEW